MLVRNYGFKKEALADPMREMFAIATGIGVESQNDIKRDAEKAPKYRRIMQMLGTEVFRDEWAQDVWIRNLERRINVARDEGFKGVVVTDARFLNEINELSKMGATLVHIDTNESWKRCPKPKWSWSRWLLPLHSLAVDVVFEVYPRLAYKLTRNPYYHPSEAETRLARNLDLFHFQVWNGGHMNKTPVDFGHGPPIRVYDRSPEEIVESFFGKKEE